MNKYIRICLIAVMLLSLSIIFKSLAFSANQQNQPREENYAQQMKQMEQEISNFKSGFYDKTMQNVNLALQGANRATSLVSLFAITFTVLTVVLGFFGIKEISSIRKVRLDTEKNLRLTNHFSLGYTYTQAFLYSEAIKEFLKVVEIDNNNDIAHTQLGYLFLSLPQPDFSKSKLHSKRAVEINQKNYTAYLNLGVAMNGLRDRQEDILTVYLKGEEIAVANLADDMTIGKFKLFAGHCYKNLKDNMLAEKKYDEARPYFKRYEDDKIPQIAQLAKRWLDELEESYKIVTKSKV